MILKVDYWKIGNSLESHFTFTIDCDTTERFEDQLFSVNENQYSRLQIKSIY